MIDVKCKNCNRLLMKAATVVAAVKCPRCGKIFEYKVFSNLHVLSSRDTSGVDPTEDNPNNG